MNSNTGNIVRPARNYYLDAIKFLFTLTVFLGHSIACFANENTNIPFAITSTSLGYVSVHAFFIISGLLMINSLYMDGDRSDPGHRALKFVIHKYKGIALPYITALLLNGVIYYIVYGKEATKAKLPFLLPEIFALMQGGTNIGMVHNHNWYISAMLISMLPLAYLLIKNQDFYINVFCPFMAVLVLGYMHSSQYSDASHYLNQYTFCSIAMGGVIRAVCGLVSGGVSWLICGKIRKVVKTKGQEIVLTVLECVLYFSFFAIWFHAGNSAQYSTVAMMILPVIIGIVFSGKSILSHIFRSHIFNKLGALSLAIYLMQWGAECIITNFIPGHSYKFSTILMLLFTAIGCFFYFLVNVIIKMLWAKKLRRILME